MSNPVSRRVTLRDVAESAGVSVSTASRALSGASSISALARDRIRQAANQLGYQGGVPSRSVTVAIDVQAVENGTGEFLQLILAGIEEESKLLGMELSIKHVAMKSAAAQLGASGSQGVLLLSMQEEQTVLALQASGTPAVIVNGREPLMRLDSIAPANRTGGYLGTRHLIELGHRNILFLNHSNRPTIRDRMLGSRKALAEAEIDFETMPAIELKEIRLDVAYRETSLWLEQQGRGDVTAIQCYNDASALGAIAALNEHGLNVPEDISVLGFDDVPAAALNSVPISTLSIDMKDLGRRGIRQLFNRIENPGELVTYVETAVSLKLRKSTASIIK